ncbi:DUF4861 domain-containing protein [Jejuia pallidilutea]|uniref:DUF4861 domain-containing protein n=1 Tax=Jejuia pallidilutea TaxID=504487 RepID=A0A090W1K3_9FLAO|nr:DUF4861 domain-containing protein [Jejuia pallidilutea]GAL67170.1 hypothetical protein JCM19301_1782 [Jejuia pallidilutea]GAL70816.1 hypothetical protein JCM19302_1979 [Jejuia pallidilutea]GAL89818.1 hypothetical protein JCM19538_3295 [Jejuia pallidilutea]
MKTLFFYAVLFIFCFVVSCNSTTQQIITVTNNLNVSRSFETVEINKTDIKLEEGQTFESLSIKDLSTNTVLVSQFVDVDNDGNADVLLFQPEINANSEKQFQLLQVEASSKPEVAEHCYSRFVPERTDDYAWENNKVAFRTYGPTAQKMVEEGVQGGTLSSGIDAWLKRVEYPIINKWYKNEQEKPGAYHIDSGEGLDNFHVGVSRGVGGIAVKVDTTYYTSKNFTSWKTITTGPIRTSFVLEYANWDANGQTITETKHISLDYGSNFSRFEIELTGTDAIYAGLTLHEKDGIPTQNESLGYISYWEPHFDSELGTAIIVPNNNMISSELFDTPVKDWSNLFAKIKVNSGKAIYYAGFGWKKAKEITSKEAWEKHIEAFALKVNNPLKVTIN